MSLLTTVSTSAELKHLITNQSHVIVMFSASWCGPCKMIKPTIERLSNEHTDTKFVYVDIEKFSDPENNFLPHARSIPTFFDYRNGLITTFFAGANTAKLNSLLGGAPLPP